MVTVLLNLAVVVWSVVPLLPDMVAMVGGGDWRALANLVGRNPYALAVVTLYGFELVVMLRRKNLSTEDVFALGVLHAALAALTLTCLFLDASHASGQGQNLATLLNQVSYKVAVAVTSLAHALRVLTAGHKADA